jgi:hypothetical protein
MPEHGVGSLLMPGSVIDFHMHTVLGAYDSGLKPEVLAEEARNVGLTGVNITEHDRMWSAHTLADFREQQSPLFVSNGMEVSTDMGHILVVGLPGFVAGIHRLARLREVADEYGAYLVVAHPFRHWFDPVHFRRQGKKPIEMVPEVLAKLPVFEYVDAIEVLNGCNTPRENLMALQVAHYLGKPGTGGSDCHSSSGIGYYCTVFERQVETAHDMVVELMAGRFAPAHDLPSGKLTLYTETSLPLPAPVL